MPLQKKKPYLINLFWKFVCDNLFILSLQIYHPQTDAVKTRYSKYYSLYVFENFLPGLHRQIRMVHYRPKRGCLLAASYLNSVLLKILQIEI